MFVYCVLRQTSTDDVSVARDADDETFCLERFDEAYAVVRAATKWTLYKRTPLIARWKDVGDLSVLSGECELYLKLENTQVTGQWVLFAVYFIDAI